MSDSQTILVTGATGKQGGAVARALLAKGHKVRALSRNPNAPAALELTRIGATVVAGSFEDAQALAAAHRGVDAAFLMGTPFEAGAEAEVAQGLAAISAAREAGVSHVVYTSVASGDKDTGIPHFDSKFKVERALQDSGLGWTILAPVYFMENLYFPQTLAGVRQGAYATPLSPSRPLQQVAVADIGAVGAEVIARRSAFAGRRIELAGDAVDGVSTARALTEVLGRPVAYQVVPMEAIRSFSEDMYLMYRYFEDVGYQVDIPALRREFPSVGWHAFPAWLATQDVGLLR